MLGEGLEGPAYHACAPNPCCMGTSSGWPEGYSMTSFSCRGLAPSSGWTASVFGRRAWSVLRGLETLYKVSSLANMMVFLRNGVYRCALIYSVCGGLFLPPSIGHRGGLICVGGKDQALEPSVMWYPHCSQSSRCLFHLPTSCPDEVLLVGSPYALRSLLERVSGARLVYEQAVMTRVISFEYLNRQLVWQELSELLLFALPLIDLPRMRRALAGVLPRLPRPASLLGAGWAATHGGRGVAASSDREAVSVVPSQGEEVLGSPGASSSAHAAASQVQQQQQQPRPGPCPMCASEEILLPYCARPCGHVFCYYCIRANCEADKAFECPLDGLRVASMRRWQEGVTGSESAS